MPSRQTGQKRIDACEKWRYHNMILRCEDCGELSQMIAQAKAQTFRPYVSHTQAILDSLEEFLQENFGNQ